MVSNSEEKILLDCPPLPEGWKREIVPRKTGTTSNRVDVYYYSPSGQKCRSKPDMTRYLGKEVDLTGFNFKACVFETKAIRTKRKAVKEQKKKRQKFVSTEKGKLLKATASTLNTDSPFSCPTCQRSFRNDVALVSHIMVHVRKSNFVCHFCDRAFYTTNAVKVHLKRHVRKRPVLTSDAPEPYVEPEPEEVKPEVKKRLENGHSENSKVADPSRPTCPECGKTYMTKSSLQIHMMNHFKCAPCDESFTDREKLDEHTKNHTSTAMNGDTT